jgi:predicted permease
VIIAVLLLMACLNVGCLLLARGAARQQEISVRLCLGARKSRLLRQILFESCLLAITGGCAGLAVAAVAERLVLAGLRYDGAPLDLSLDARVLACGLGASLLTGILCGIAPAIQLLRGGLLVKSDPRVVGAFSSGRALVVVEIALSVIMIAGAAMFLRGFWILRSAPLGFDARNMPVVELRIRGDLKIPPADSEKVLLQAAARVADRLRPDPRFAAVAVANTLPFGDGYVGMPVQRTDLQIAPHQSTMVRVDDHYLNAMGISISVGRAISESDDQSAPNVAIVGETLARHLFPNENPLGKELQAGRQRLTVIGVAKDIKFESLKNPAPELFYVPIAQMSQVGAQMGTAKIHMRTRLRPADVEALVQQTVLAEQAPVRVVDTVMLDEEIGYSYFNDTVRMQATVGLGGIALLLIAAGLYGLMAYWVTQRSREIGLRMAIGSTSAGIMSIVLKQSLRLVAFGLIIGGPIAILLTRDLASMVFGAPPTDYAAVGVAAMILTATAVLAAVIPARRAATLDPLEALRVE